MPATIVLLRHRPTAARRGSPAARTYCRPVAASSGSGHAHGHAHDHGHRHAGRPGVRRRLALALGIALVVLVVEVVGGLLSGSLALLADAAQVAADAAGLGLALVAVTLAARPPSARRTFGWQRSEVLAAAVDAVLLLGVGAWVLVEAGTMAAVAAVGLVANGVSLLLLRGGGDDLNLRGATLEVASDLLGSVAVLAGAGAVALTGSPLADPVVGMVISAAILPRTWLLLREAVDVLLEATPRSVDLDLVREHLLGAAGVLDVHDLHAWTITSGVPVLSAHVVVEDAVLADGHGGALLDRLLACLDGHFDVEHSTLQLEGPGHRDHEGVLHA